MKETHMLYAVIPLKPTPALREKIQTLNLPVYDREAPAVYLVSFQGTAQELSEVMGYGHEEIGTGLVIAFDWYHGYASPNLWEWLKVHKYA